MTNIVQQKMKMGLQPEVYAATVRRVTLAGMVVNILLSIVKFILGSLGASQALVADAVHSLSDLSTDVAVLFGVKYWSAPADEDHPYGHSRIESIVSAAIGLFLAGVAVGIGYNALVSIRSAEISQPGWIAFIGALFSIGLKEIMYHWTVRTGRRIKSTALLANAWHHRSDALSSIPVAVAVVVAMASPGWWFVDRIGALVVTVFILHASWKIVGRAITELTDKGASEKERLLIRSLVRETEGVKSVHAIRTRRVGSGLHVDLHVQVDGMLTVRQGHDISRVVRDTLLAGGPEVLDVVVHTEPHESEKE